MAQQNSGQAQPLIKPEQVENLPFLTAEQKTQYKLGLTQLWQQLETLPQGSPQHLEVQTKLRTASQKLMQQLAAKGNRPGSQGRPAQATPGQPGMAGNAQNSQNPQAGQQQAPAGLATLPANVRAELQQFKVHVPPNILQQGVESAAQYRRKFITHLGGLLQRKEAARLRGAQTMQNAQRFSQAGQPVPPELQAVLTKAREEMNRYEHDIRAIKAKNDEIGGVSGGAEMQRQGSTAGQQTQPNNPQQQQQAQQNAMQAANNAQAQQDAKGNIVQQRPPQQPSQVPGGFQQQQNAAQVAPSTTPQSAVAPSPSSARPPQQTPQSATQPHPPQNFPQQQNISHAQQAQQRLPQINTAQIPQQQTGQQGAAPSAIPQSAGQQQQQQPPQRPQPLTHQAAINQAAEMYARQQSQTQVPQVPQQAQVPQVPNGVPMNGPPNSAGAGQTPTSAYPTNSQQSQQGQQNQARWPIPKTLTLEPRTQAPVSGPASRPTLGNTGMMQQPGAQRAPVFTLEGEGDRVLSKRKLDELVRQVTGGAEDGGLAPDVEEAVLTLADDFVDNVIVAACRLAKLRSSQTLDIRDIQMVLERNYGIRIPGYSLDEMRTVRKFQPAPGWQSKMQAIQAGKVMGNKDS